MGKRRQTLTFIGYFFNLSLHNFSFSHVFAVCVMGGGGYTTVGYLSPKYKNLRILRLTKKKDMYYMPNKFILMS